MDTAASDFVRAGTFEELKAKGRLVLHGRHRPILVVHEGGRVRTLDNRCPHLGFPLDRGSVDDGVLTCHWHHARFELAGGCTLRSVGGRRAELALSRNPRRRRNLGAAGVRRGGRG